MRVKRWGRPLLRVGLLSLGLYALPAAAQDAGTAAGTQVVVKLPTGSGELPDAEKLVESVMGAGGGERQVQVKRTHSPEQQELTMQLWGNVIPAADIPRTLREGFPVLAKADIQVSALDPSQKLKFDEAQLRGTQDGKGVKRVIRKEVKETEQK